MIAVICMLCLELRTVVDGLLQVSTHKRQHLVHDFSVKFSPCVCSHSSCPDQTNVCNLSACMITYIW